MRRLLVTAGLALLAVAGTAAALEARSTASFDFGDAPDGVKAGYAGKPDVVARFPSKAASGGPRHGSAGPRLGTRWSAEGNSRQVDRDADDGAAVTPRSCALSTLRIVVDLSRVPDDTPVYVNAWFDWNRDGDWGDGGNARCGPEWGVQNHRIDRATLRGAPVDAITIRFRAGSVPKEFWWRVQVHVGAPAPHQAGAGSAAAGGEIEDYLFPVASAAPALSLSCKLGVAQHGLSRGHWPSFYWSLVKAPRGARLKLSHVRALGPTDGLKLFWGTHLDYVDVMVQAKEHVREPRVQIIHVEVTSRVNWPGGTGIARGACPIVIRHAPLIPSETGHQSQFGSSRVSVAVINPNQPTPESARCRARFVAIGFTPGAVGAAGGTVDVRCDGTDVKLVTLGVLPKIASFSSAGRCETGSGLRCYFRGPNKGRAVRVTVRTDQPFASQRLHVLAGGTGEGGTAIVLLQDFFFQREGLVCRQQIPRADTCATL